ncbi:hypothetical protein [Pelagicoccus sp. SDUM812003]|uniref:energy transducer TonB n=1 Tax=Pelagicoccus sp. SDUM812003 TaxID=3041267 RepID=UPI00280FCCEB|nr:hypothetical protein [Pelagicoccus sp. SDUM812003]MDQ8202300.1 hypothetical protein [Pelagicoccus sp. SDUM812003]
MTPLEKQLRGSKLHPVTFFGGILVSAAVFVSMGMTQLKIDYPEPAPIFEVQDVYLPPPPPPPPAKTPPKRTSASINFNVPSTSESGELPLGFLEIDFGLSPKKLTENSLSVAETIENYETESMEELTVFDFADVTEKPKVYYTPPLQIPPHLIGNTDSRVTFTYLCRVDTKGRPHDIHILDTDYPEAVPTLVEWVKRMRFKPAVKDGEKVNCIVRRKTTYISRSNSSPFSI